MSLCQPCLSKGYSVSICEGGKILNDRPSNDAADLTQEGSPSPQIDNAKLLQRVEDVVQRSILPELIEEQELGYRGGNTGSVERLQYLKHLAATDTDEEQELTAQTSQHHRSRRLREKYNRFSVSQDSDNELRSEAPSQAQVLSRGLDELEHRMASVEVAPSANTESSVLMAHAEGEASSRTQDGTRLTSHFGEHNRNCTIFDNTDHVSTDQLSPAMMHIQSTSRTLSSQAQTYGSIEISGSARAIVGNVINNNYHAPNMLELTEAQNSPEKLQAFISAVLSAAAQYGVGVPRVPAGQSKDSVAQWVSDVFEAFACATTIWDGQPQKPIPSEGTSLEHWIQVKAI